MNEINFLPPSYLKQQSRQRRVYREAALVVLTVLSIGGWQLSTRDSLKPLQEYAQAIEVEAAAARTQMLESARLESERQSLLEQLRTRQELEQSVGMAAVVATIGKLMPRSIVLQDLTIEGKHPTPAAVETSADGQARRTRTPARQSQDALKFQLSGLAPADIEIADFVGRLTAHGLFDKVKMLHSRWTQAGEYQAREFRIEFEVPLDRDYEPVGRTQEVADAG